MRIKQVMNSKTDSFGTKTVVFLGDNHKYYIISAEEGSHSDLECGKEVYSAQEIKSVDGILNLTIN